MAPTPKHRTAIVDAAVTLFRQKGYSATGINDIAGLARAPRGSVYHYFPAGKAAIGEAAVREAGCRICETVQALAAEAPDAGALVKAHAHLLAQWMAQSGYRDGAPMATVLLENAPSDPAITAAGLAAQTGWRRILQDKLVADGFPPERAERLATLAMAVLDGALIQMRVAQSDVPLVAAAEEFAALLASARG